MNAPTPDIRWGVIGFGRFGRIHADVIRSLPGVRLAAICTRNEELLAKGSIDFPEARPEADYRRVLDDPDIDAVSVTTHWRDHFRIANDALAAGKHVLLEKPMAASRTECAMLLAAAAEAQGKLMVGHVCRFDTRVALAKRAIDQGQIGRIVSMHAKRNLPRAPGSLRLDKISPLMGDGIHDADLMMWFTGAKPSRVYARQVRVDDFEFPDLGWAMFEFGGAAIGVVETVWCLPVNVPTVIDARFEVIGTDGMLTIDCANTGLTILDGDGPHKPDTAYWPLVHDQRNGALRSELEYFAACIRSGEQPSVVTPVEAANAVVAIEAAEAAAAADRALTVDGYFAD